MEVQGDLSSPMQHPSELVLSVCLLSVNMKKRSCETSTLTSGRKSEHNVDIFPVIVIAMSPSYDLYVIYHSEIFYTVDSAIYGARKMFYAGVNDWFRGGATVSDLPFALENIENYAVKHFRRIWKFGGEGDSPQITAAPCPAFVIALQTGLHNSTPELIWTLPACPIEQYFHTLPNLLEEQKVTTKKPHLNISESQETHLDLFLTYGGIFQPIQNKIELQSYVQLSGLSK